MPTSSPSQCEAQLQQFRREAIQIARRIVGPNDAEDAVQDASIRAVQHYHNFDPTIGTFRAWYARIVKNCALAMKQKQRNDVSFESEELEFYVAPAPEDTEDDFLRSLAKDESARLVRTAMQNLTPEDRTAIDLVYLQDMDRGLVARKLRINQAALRMRLCRACKLLMQQLEWGGVK